MSENYWSQVLRNRVARRRALASAGALTAAGLALSLAGCGGGGGEPAEKLGDKSGLLSVPVDTTAQAKPGGTLRDYQSTDVLHYDATASNASGVVNLISVFAYPRLLKFALGKHPKEPDGSSEGDLAESFEIRGDRLQVTLKLRPNLKWDSRAPTSGRVIEAQDVVFSWNKFGSLNPAALDMVYDAQKAPNSPVESITAPDSRTVVMKLKQPDASLIPLLSSSAQFYVEPKEADGGFDPKTEIRGYGPWILEEHTPSARLVWRRNPDYYVKGRPFPDKLERPIVSDNAQRLAQFRAGNIWTDVLSALQENIVQTKRDVPETNLRQSDSFARNGNFITFGYEGNSPWKDVRMRQAVSMLLDREAYIDVIENREAFRKEGLEPPIASNSVVYAGWPGYWLDPQNEKDFGANRKYLQYDVPEAKKLMTAAGFSDGVEFDFIYNRDQTYGPVYAKGVELYSGMFLNGGLRPKQTSFPYNQYLENYYFGYLSKDYASGAKKGYNGIVYEAERGFPSIEALLYGTMHKDGSVFHGMTPDGRNPHLGDPKLNELIEKIKQEVERPRQQSLVHDLIRYFTGQSYYVPRPSTSKGFNLTWPAIGNLGAFPGYGGGNTQTETRINWWVDSSKPPLTKV